MSHIGVGNGAADKTGVQDMRNRTECSKLCPMLNRFGFCESALRRAESVKECPHRRMRSGVSPREGGRLRKK